MIPVARDLLQGRLQGYRFQVRVQNCLLRVPPLGHATRLFAFLAKSELARTLDETNDCFMGSWTRDFLKDHPTSEDEECKC